MLISAFYAGFAALMMVFLSFNVSLVRAKTGIKFGNKNNDMRLQRAIRAHGNFVEYAPMFLIILGYSEVVGLSSYFVHAAAIVFFIGRIFHAFGLLVVEKYENGELVSGMWCRFIGQIISVAAILVLALTLLTLVLS